MRTFSAKMMAALIGMLPGRHEGVPEDVRAELSKNPFHSLHFVPHGGFERVLAGRGANCYHSKPQRARRLNQASAHARRRLGVA